MINKSQLYLYRLRPVKLGPTLLRINQTHNKEKLKSNISGTIVFGYGRLFYLISCRKYDIGTPVLFSEEKEERKLLLGRIKEVKKIEINGIIAHKLLYYPFFSFNLFIKREGLEDLIITNYIEELYGIIYKILELKDYKIIYE